MISRQVCKVPSYLVDFVDVSPKQVVAVATAYSFLGETMTLTVPSWVANMQRPLCPLIDPKAPYVGTGMEYQTYDLRAAVIVTLTTTKSCFSDADRVDFVVKMVLLMFYTIQNSSLNSRYCNNALVKVSDIVEKGDFIMTVHHGRWRNGPQSKPYRHLHDMGRLQLQCRYHEVSVL